MVGALICNQSIPVRIWVVALAYDNSANLKVEMIHTLSGLRSSTVKPANVHVRLCIILYYIILIIYRKVCQSVMHSELTGWKMQNCVSRITFGSRRWKWCWQRKPTNSVSALCREERYVEKHGIVLPWRNWQARGV